ncbi:MAG: hypothetical protein R3C03_22485 [Pirellulaceae bacterium]
MSKALLELIRCPLTREKLHEADASLVERVNEMIGSRKLTNRGGVTVEQSLDSGLMNESNQWLIPVRKGIVSMLVDEFISIERIKNLND